MKCKTCEEELDIGCECLFCTDEQNELNWKAWRRKKNEV